MTCNFIMIKKLVLGRTWTGDLPIFSPDALTFAPLRQGWRMHTHYSVTIPPRYPSSDTRTPTQHFSNSWKRWMKIEIVHNINRSWVKYWHGWLSPIIGAQLDCQFGRPSTEQKPIMSRSPRGTGHALEPRDPCSGCDWMPPVVNGQWAMNSIDTPWWPVLLLNFSLAHRGIPWHIVAYRGTSWHTVAHTYRGTSWHTVAHRGIRGTSWHTVAHRGIPWHIVAYRGT